MTDDSPIDGFDVDGEIPADEVPDLIDASDMALLVVASLDPAPAIGDVDPDEKQYQATVKSFKVSQ